jgi:hypothetical protein
MTSLFRKLFKVRKCRYGCANFCGDHTCCYHCIIKDSCILSCKHPNYNYHYSDCGSCLGWGFDDVKVLLCLILGISTACMVDWMGIFK